MAEEKFIAQMEMLGYKVKEKAGGEIKIVGKRKISILKIVVSFVVLVVGLGVVSGFILLPLGLALWVLYVLFGVMRRQTTKAVIAGNKLFVKKMPPEIGRDVMQVAKDLGLEIERQR